MDRLEKNNIVSEVSTSFVNYSLSVITSRALPDLRDGLKPVHRRILYSVFLQIFASILLLTQSFHLISFINQGIFRPQL